MADPNQSYGPGYPPTLGYAPPPTGYPQGGYPQGGYPQGGYPQAGYPPGAGYPPQGGYPPSGGYPPPQEPYQPGFIPPQPDAAYGQSSNYRSYNDPEVQDDDVKRFPFNNQSIRRAFIRKVYAILMIQLAITTGFIAVFVFHKGTRFWALRHPELFWVAFAFAIITLISMACCESVRRKSPINIIFLVIFTIAESILGGYASIKFDITEVLMAFGFTVLVTFGITLFTFQTKWDFTMLSGGLFVFGLVMLGFGILAFVFRDRIVLIVYLSLAVLLFSLYLVYNTQLVVCANCKHNLSPDEYILGAILLYVNIIELFMIILSLIGIIND